MAETTRRVAGAVARRRSCVGARSASFAAYGSPPTLARHAYHSFVSTPTGGSDLNSRLFTLSNNGRTVLWHSALDEFLAHPVVGSGAGSFGRWWLAHRTTAYFVQDAHNLYVQTLGRGGVQSGSCCSPLLLGLPLDRRGARSAASARRACLRRVCRVPRPRGRRLGLADAGGDAARALRRRGDGRCRATAASRGSSREARRSGSALGGSPRSPLVVAFVGLIGNIALRERRARNPERVRPQGGRRAQRRRTAGRRGRRKRSESSARARCSPARNKPGWPRFGESAAKDPGDWRAWYDIAVITSGPEHRVALARARALNPYGPELAAVARTP